MKKKSKRYKNLKEIYKKKESIKFDQVLKELKNGSSVKFVESIDISMKINLKKIKGADNNLRTLIELPHGNGKKIRVGLLCDENKLAEAQNECKLRKSYPRTAHAVASSLPCVSFSADSVAFSTAFCLGLIVQGGICVVRGVTYMRRV